MKLSETFHKFWMDILGVMIFQVDYPISHQKIGAIVNFTKYQLGEKF